MLRPAASLFFLPLAEDPYAPRTEIARSCYYLAKVAVSYPHHHHSCLVLIVVILQAVRSMTSPITSSSITSSTSSKEIGRSSYRKTTTHHHHDTSSSTNSINKNLTRGGVGLRISCYISASVTFHWRGGAGSGAWYWYGAGRHIDKGLFDY